MQWFVSPRNISTAFRGDTNRDWGAETLALRFVGTRTEAGGINELNMGMT
jgi:hypothetical protein